jgi:hypothetical protein
MIYLCLNTFVAGLLGVETNKTKGVPATSWRWSIEEL